MYKQYRCASHRPSGTALPPQLGSQLFIHLTAAALPSADFSRRTGLKKGSSVRPSPSSPTFVSLAPTPVRSPDRGHLSALCDSNCRPRRSCARRRCSTPMCELLVVCRWRKGNVRGVVRPCRGRWSAWSFTRNHRSLQVAGCSVVRPWAPGLHARVAVEEGGVEPR